MKAENLPHSLEGMMVHVIEECAEVQKSITKCFRFGMKSSHPSYEGGKENQLVMRLEILDLRLAIDRLEEELARRESQGE